MKKSNQVVFENNYVNKCIGGYGNNIWQSSTSNRQHKRNIRKIKKRKEKYKYYLKKKSMNISDIALPQKCLYPCSEHNISLCDCISCYHGLDKQSCDKCKIGTMCENCEDILFKINNFTKNIYCMNERCKTVYSLCL